MPYALKVRTDEPLNHVDPRIREALKEEGFGVLTEIDVQATLKEKLGIERGPMRILGACNPALAHQALEAEPDVSVFLPCNVTLHAHEGRTVVSAMKPTAALTLVQNDAVAKIAEDAEARIVRALRAALPGQDVEGA